MHDLRSLRDNLDALRAKLGPRGADVAWDDVRKLLEERRSLIATVEDLRHQLKNGSDEVGRLKRAKQSADALTAEMKALGARIASVEESLRSVEERVTDLAQRIPNVPHASVPAGMTPSDNVEARRWGSAPQFGFQPKSHWDIG